MTHESGTPALRELLVGISADAQTLTRQTLALARLEVASAASATVRSAIGIAVGVLLVLAGAAVLVCALVLIAVALGMAPWAAASLIGLMLVVGGTLAASYFFDSLLRIEWRLNETRQSLTDTIDWFKRQAGD